MDPDSSRFVLLVVLDGWGISSPGAGNAISQANTVNMNRFWASYPHTELIASGESVGLPRGEAGNTETGHLNLGAGHIVYQDLQKINMSIADGSFFQNQTLIGAIKHAIDNNSNLHYMGLIGASGVHSNIDHLYALIELAKKNNFNRLYLHLFTDGRDSPPTSAKTYISQLRDVMTREGIGTIATLMGRYWAMDRDLRWDRTEKAYVALTGGVGHLVKTPEEAIDYSYSEGKTDEFIEPSVITDASGKPIATIKDNDSVVFFNFRIDRPRQLSKSFVATDFRNVNVSAGFDPYQIKYQKTHLPIVPVGMQGPFDRGPKLKNLCFVTMTEYDKSITASGATVAFPPEIVKNPLGLIISEAGFRQLRASESEKERFVTIYFNGLQETSFEGEDHLIVSSPKVATYDLKPEMSARELTNAVLNKIKDATDYKFVLINFANADMLGHTGNIGATVQACNVVDECLEKLSSWVLAYGGTMLITADHGNAEEMIDKQSGQIDTEHNGNPVPFIAISRNLVGKSQTLTSGILADIAPTVLHILGLPVPSSMVGRDLLDSL
jgi:2,3-bisphosphoglycerate-independent phosphoglycerate mutase